MAASMADENHERASAAAGLSCAGGVKRPAEPQQQVVKRMGTDYRANQSPAGANMHRGISSTPSSGMADQ